MIGAEAALKRAGDLLKSHAMADSWTADHGRLCAPVPVEHPRGTLHSWFVPVVYGDNLLGFFELSPDLVPLRYSSFQRHAQQLEGCPAAAAWLDVGIIRRKAETLLRADETAEQPFLTYDAVPSRLAWAVPVIRSKTNEQRVVYVAGDAVFEGRGEGAFTGR